MRWFFARIQRGVSPKCHGNTLSWHISGRDARGHVTSSLASENGAMWLDGRGDGILSEAITDHANHGSNCKSQLYRRNSRNTASILQKSCHGDAAGDQCVKPRSFRMLLWPSQSADPVSRLADAHAGRTLCTSARELELLSPSRVVAAGPYLVRQLQNVSPT